MRQRLNLAQALLGEPRVVVLDEPSNGFDVEGVGIFYETVRELLDRGVVAVLSSHLFAEIQGRVGSHRAALGRRNPQAGAHR